MHLVASNARQVTVETYVRQRPRINDETSSSKGAPIFNNAIKIDETTLEFNPSNLRALAPSAMYSRTRGRQNYNQRFYFKRVFDQQNSEEEICTEISSPLIDCALDGDDSLLFAYGATGCGKSYTINSIHVHASGAIFHKISLLPASKQVNVKLKYYQLYNEKPFDLLCKAQRPLSLRTCGNEGVQVVGLVEHHVRNAEEMLQCIQQGNANRIVAATQANSQSSRSHAILSIEFDINDTEGGMQSESTFTIIDLAGNERAQATQNKGIRLKEGGDINRSLLALGQCLKARATKMGRAPYRDSSLTRVLKRSLEGQGRTSMIVCISPCMEHFEETRNSLVYSQIARSLTSRAQPNQQRPISYSYLQNQISELSTKLALIQEERDNALLMLKEERQRCINLQAKLDRSCGLREIEGNKENELNRTPSRKLSCTSCSPTKKRMRELVTE